MKIGILGGGQLGRMLLQAASNYEVDTYVMENDNNCPAAKLCTQFVRGDIRNYEDVLHFGEGLDAITIEIENVNADALDMLAQKGVRVYPDPRVLKIIQSKIKQKEFYKKHDIPTAEYLLTNHSNEIYDHLDFLPAVHKISTGGYDGRGVEILRTESDVRRAFDKPAVLEKMQDIFKEISVVIASDGKGQDCAYPAVEMIFREGLNELDYLLSPARIPQQAMWKAEAIARRIVQEFKSPGIFAIEMFVDPDFEIVVNETAPRVHNSAHQTIEGNYCSQFDMLIRILMNYPLGNPSTIIPSAMVNLLGADGYNGKVYYKGIEKVLKMENVSVHLYGKKETRPGRKMGHVTILGDDYEDLIIKTKEIKENLLVISQ